MANCPKTLRLAGGTSRHLPGRRTGHQLGLIDNGQPKDAGIVIGAQGGGDAGRPRERRPVRPRASAPCLAETPNGDPAALALTRLALTRNEEDRTSRSSSTVLRRVPQPLTTPSGVSRFVALTSDAEAAITDSMSLYANAASSATSFGSEERSTTPSASISA